jgi:fucose permease
MLGCALLPLLIETPLIWPMVFLWGAVSYGIYTMTLIELGERFAGSMLVAGNAAFSLMWGLGGIAVPPAAGSALDLLGARGLPITLGLLCLVLAVASVARRRVA